ncbi:MAG: cytochrome c [Acidobacteriota bacterium]|nr:cytochrome c [Acidobacteriota bacterium]
MHSEVQRDLHRPLVLLTILVVCASAAVAGAEADDADIYRLAHLDYMLHCQGCHMADGAGVEGTVPPLPGEVGKYIASPEWRDYLVQVPGASQALIDDEALARLMTWIVRRFDPENAKDLKPYEAAEVGRLRSQPVTNPTEVRRRIIAELSEQPQDD